VTAVASIEPVAHSRVQGALVEHWWLARELEQQLLTLSRSGRVGPFQPAERAMVAAIGATHGVRAADFVFGTERDWPVALVRGLSATEVVTQMFGGGAGPQAGRTIPGAIHNAGARLALSAGSAAAHILHAAGFGLAARLQARPQVALALFGTVAYGHSDLHAALDLAAQKNAQTVFVARGPRGGEASLEGSGAAWGIRTIRVDGDHGMAVFLAVERARERAIAGDGPTLIDARHSDHRMVPHDALALQAQGRLSAEVERAEKAHIRTQLWAARNAAEKMLTPADSTLQDHVTALGEPGHGSNQ
jgi:2-oxoisovalerate dehydrogenase E1 component alpha subunit